ncbi:DNA-processing protein DprA [Halobellus sp. GM3]|uniref:DNA-processing protein DprA n=1 Tax=Halobellus sp. GM3 TaxID=3458410 RepID=UPI00403D7D42
MNLDTLSRLVALTELRGVGDKRALQLYDAFDSLDRLYAADSDAFDAFHYVDGDTVEELHELGDAVDRNRERFRRCEAEGIDVIGIEDPRYPAALRRDHAPLVMYARGETDLLARPSVSFAGSRDTDERGRQWAREVAEALAEEYVIVSGGALGVDTAAHEGALRAGGETIVVFGTGVKRPYPEENRALFERILESGGLVVSHRPPDAGPSRHGFLHRNKTNSALSEGIVVVATDGSGGTMSQYRDAVSQGTPVFVPPPELGVTPTGGIREMLDAGDATAVTSAADVHRWLRDLRVESSADRSQAGADRPDADDEQSSLGEWT